jgi:tartrate-resistant acid phosphatase type 5
MIKNKTSFVFLALLFISVSLIGQSKHISKSGNSNNSKSTSKQTAKPFNFLVISDWGWNGYKKQQEVADEFGVFAETSSPKFIVSCGDNFQVQGVASAQDPLWAFNFENVYKNISLQIDWFPVLGNHDYKGNTQAEIDYSKISRRWRMESHYYTFVRKINDSISARFIFLDTPPLINEYYKNPGYPDVFTQDSAKQLAWLKDVLANSKEQWKLVFGHHPVYSASQVHGDTPELISRLRPLFEKYNVQFYICGHDHDMQHLKEKNGNVDYMVNGTGGEPRPATMGELNLFSKSEPGFSAISLYSDSLKFSFINSKGESVYSIKRGYKKQK